MNLLFHKTEVLKIISSRALSANNINGFPMNQVKKYRKQIIHTSDLPRHFEY